MQYITRKTTFDSGHRVMNEKMKCFNVHGHTYICEMTFEFQEMKDIGYAVDFKEIKRVGCQFIDDFLDHAFIANPNDKELIKVNKKLNSKLWVMSLEIGYCNPTAENISKEIFLILEILFMKVPLLSINKIRLWETPNCSVECFGNSITKKERMNFVGEKFSLIDSYRKRKGIMNYDDRKNEKS